MPKQEIGPNQEKWLAALESGKHEQGTGGLCTSAGRMCCLGVGCHVFDLPTTGTKCGFKMFGEHSEEAVAPSELVDLLALRDCFGRFEKGIYLLGNEALTDSNDKGATFQQIAAFCRGNPEAVFTEAR